MKAELDGGLILYGAVPGDRSAWAIAPGLVLAAEWLLDEPDWWREKVLVHEREHYDEEAGCMAAGLILGLVIVAALGWPWPFEATIVFLASQLAWYAPYALWPAFRSRSELSAEAAEKLYVAELGHWEPTREQIGEVLDSHVRTYYTSRKILRGSPPDRAWLWDRFVGYLRDGGMSVGVVGP